MPFTFASPRFLLLLLALPLAVWMGKRTLAGLDPWRRRLALGLRLLGILLLTCALAELQWKDVLDTVQVIFVVDQSLSIPKEEQHVALDVINAATKDMDKLRDKAKLIVFGKDARIETSLEKGSEVLVTSSYISREHTDIQSALRAALGAFDSNVRKRIVLVTDGNETIGDARAGVAQAKLQQARVDVVPLDYSYENEILVDKLVIPAEAKIGEPFKVRVVTNAFKPAKARISLFQEGSQVEVHEVDLTAGANVEMFDMILKKPGFFRVSAVVNAIDSRDDKLYQNNEGNGFVFVKGESSVLYVHRAGDEEAISRPLVEALEAERLSLTKIPVTHFPQQASGLQVYDAIILDDVPRDAFSQAQLEAIEFAVANEGIGLVMLGGEHSFGCGDWRDTPVEKALPVDMDIKEESTIPNGALVIVMHSSELPDANRWAIQVIKASIDTLSRRDQVGLMQYGMMGGVEWVFKLQPAIDKTTLKTLADKLSPGDMPDFDAVFVSALDSLKPAQAAVKHMILLSDGDPSPPRPEVLAAYKQGRITCSTVAFGAHDGRDGAQHNAMKRIASELGGKCYFIDGPQELPKIFTRETQRVRRSLIVNDHFTPRFAQKSEVLKGIDGLPPLEGHVLTEPKPRAEVPLVSHKGAPILAHWQYGAGKSLAFTSDATNRWAQGWVRWSGFQNFWAQAIRWVSKDVAESPFQVATKVVGETGKVLLDAVDDHGEFIDGLSVEGVVRSPKDERTNVTLRQVGPGRYEGDFPAKEVGAYTVSVLTKNKDGKRQHSFTTGMVFPYSEEFKKLKTDRVLLAALAR
ncbi:VWA domain-containing protein, partial [bacterium]|nr:VWA domain-containing protein [bacterium]